MQATKKQQKMLGRLKRRSDFLRVQNKGRKWVSKSLVLQILPEAVSESEKAPVECRAGFTVSKRVSKSAVVRNRVKRRLRAAAADILPLYAVPGTDYVLVGRAETPGRSYDEIKNDLKWCLKRLAAQMQDEARPL